MFFRLTFNHCHKANQCFLMAIMIFQIQSISLAAPNYSPSNFILFTIAVSTVTDNAVIITEKYDFQFTCPNPCNSTTITYGLPHPGNVSLQLYNPLGQQISTLFEGNRQAGIYTTNLTGRNLVSGLYFVRLEVAEQVFTRKVLLVR